MSATHRSRPSPKPDERAIRLGRQRAALIVYRLVNDEPHFLLVSAASCPDKLTLPGGKVGRGEAATQTAMRETAEEAGVLTDAPRPLGRYLHRKRKRWVFPTKTFVARYSGRLKAYEDRTRRWLTVEELADPSLNVSKQIRKQLKRAAAQLSEDRAAA